MRSDASTDAIGDSLSASFSQLAVSSSPAHSQPAFQPLPSPAQPCALCGFHVPAAWLDDAAMSYYFARLRTADSADVAGKLSFWQPLLAHSQTHQACDSSGSQRRTRLSLTLHDMQQRFVRVSRRVHRSTLTHSLTQSMSSALSRTHRLTLSLHPSLPRARLPLPLRVHSAATLRRVSTRYRSVEQFER